MHTLWWLHKSLTFTSALQSKKYLQITGAYNNFQQIKHFDFGHALRMSWSNPRAKTEFMLQKISFQIKITAHLLWTKYFIQLFFSHWYNKIDLSHASLIWSSHIPQISREPLITKCFFLLTVII